MSISRALVVHSGGPTAVLNASLAGVIEACQAGLSVDALWGTRFGVEGLLTGDWADLYQVDWAFLQSLKQAPGSAIGSSRKPLERDQAEKVVEDLRRRRIDGLFFTGGNGSMATARMLSEIAAEEHPALRVIGVPKTVDNDLLETDHSPGFGSAARFYALATRDIGADNRGLPAPVTVIEVIGRNAGWVTGAAALARERPDDAPHLIYMPERPPTLEAICRDVSNVVRRLGRAVLVACEGLRDPDGNPFGADLDRAGSRRHELARNLGHSLAQGITTGTGLRARSEKPGLLGRSCSFAVSEIDADESYRCGKAAVAAASGGHGGVMVALKRISAGPYACETFLTPLEMVAGEERLVPDSWITPSGSDVTQDFVDYVRPLAGPIAPRPELEVV